MIRYVSSTLRSKYGATTQYVVCYVDGDDIPKLEIKIDEITYMDNEMRNYDLKKKNSLWEITFILGQSYPGESVLIPPNKFSVRLLSTTKWFNLNTNKVMFCNSTNYFVIETTYDDKKQISIYTSKNVESIDVISDRKRTICFDRNHNVTTMVVKKDKNISVKYNLFS